MSVEAKGSAYVQLEVSGRWAVSLLTKGWTDAEKQLLLDGDGEAREELFDEAIRRVLASPDDADPVVRDLHLAPTKEPTS